MKRTILASVLLPLVSFAGKPNIQLQIDPPRSVNGEMIKFNVSLRLDSNTPVRAPGMPPLSDWRVANAFDSQSVSSTLVNGRIATRFQYEYTWFLRPLRTGNLKIPPLIIYVGQEPYKTEEVTVAVDRLPDGSTRPNSPPLAGGGPHHQPVTPDAQDPMGDPSTPMPNFTPPARQAFFVKAEASKTNVYQGELITLSYSLYEKNPSVNNPEISKFPDFKGFLKEELLVPKTLARTPVALNGTTYYRSELIRYALFPLKAGQLKIEPLLFKADFFYNPVEDMIQNLMNGVMPQNLQPGQAMPMRKSTESIVINAKPLPAAPADAKFTGGVGRFEMDLKGPTGPVVVDQPFNLILTVKGQGNIKVLEEPSLDLPKNIEPYQTKSAYEFREDASGEKTFEYLLLPRSPGPVKIDNFRWTYFDPKTEKYVTLSAPPVSFSIEGAAAAPTTAATPAANAPAPSTWSVLVPRGQDFVAAKRIGATTILASTFAWGVQALLYAMAGLLLTRRRLEEQDEALFKNSPWEKTSRRILGKKQWPAEELALLIDQWARERITGALPDTGIHSESPRDEVFDALRNKLHPEKHKQIEPLRSLWSELDVLRFTGRKSGEAAKSQEWLDKARRAVEPLVKA